jgi:hypothetical protein
LISSVLLLFANVIFNLGGNSDYVTAKLCIDNNDGDNTPSCKSQRASDNNNVRDVPTSSGADDRTNHNNADRFEAHKPFNHDGGNIDHHNTDNHKDGGNGHHSKDDTPFSLPFP